MTQPARPSARDSEQSVMRFPTPGLRIALVGVIAGAILAAGVTQARAATITEFSAGITPGSEPRDIMSGPDGNLWFTEEAGGLARVTPSGMVTERPDRANAAGIATGPDGNLWITFASGEYYLQKTYTESEGSISWGAIAGFEGRPEAISVGPGGNLWFTESSGQIARLRISPNMEATSFKVEFSGGLNNLVLGPDGNLWLTTKSKTSGPTMYSNIDRYAVGVGGTEYHLPFSEGPDTHEPWDIAAGPDGNLWFTEPKGDRIGRITTKGVITEFSSGITAGGGPWDIAAGPDGNVWFTERAGSRVGRITPAGVVTEFSGGITPGSRPIDITTGPDGNVWFTEEAGRVGRINIGASTACPTLQVETTTLPAATRGVAYKAQLEACGGSKPYKWKKVGKFPKGLKLTKTGVIEGVPSSKVAPGSYPIGVTVTDTEKPKKSATASLTLKVS